MSAQTLNLAELHELYSYLQEQNDSDGFLRLLLDLVIRRTGAASGYILLRNEDDTTFEISVAQNSSDTSWANGLDTAAQSLVELVTETGRSLIIADAAEDERLSEIVDDESQTRAYLVVPMLLASRPVGMICLAAKRVGNFSEEQQFFVDILSTQAALVVDRERQVQITHRVEEARSEFISLTSHELRVPLTALSGYTDIILGGMVGSLNEQQQTFMRTIRRNIDRMRILIDSLGEMNRIDGRRRKFDLQAMDLAEMLEAAILVIEDDMSKRVQDLAVDVDPTLPLVLADRAAVQGVLIAMIDNASRYSPDEAIISVAISRSEEFVLLEIVDAGVGISNDDQKQLFTPFFRSDDPRIREHVGWGLALAHAKKVIDALGGTIGFNSSLGQGSTFYFTIPLMTPGVNSD